MGQIDSGKQLFGEIRLLIESSKQRASVAVNRELSMLYWSIGRRLDHEILQGERADYGKQVIASLSQQLTTEYGRGWSKRQLHYCLRFSQCFPDEAIVHALSAQLTWTHLRQLIGLEDELKRDFYIEMCRMEGWSSRQLQERIDSQLFERTAISRKLEQIELLELDKSGIHIAEYLCCHRVRCCKPIYTNPYNRQGNDYSKEIKNRESVIDDWILVQKEGVFTP